MITQLKKEHLYGSHIPAGIERSDITNFFGTIGEYMRGNKPKFRFG